MNAMTALGRLARMAQRRSDVVIVAFVVTALVMIVIPLPTMLIDLMIGINICFSLLVLAIAFYITRPVEFSTLPAVILLSTLFRLSLSIATTRLILLNGDAGQVVAAFGEFVIAGQVVVGLVVFLVVTISQFLVITKGAERVAEVAARFTLDAMPGKQMSIDNDLRNGDIDKDAAKLRRQSLERENQLFGAMDGAMKFVKGDAIAALVIVIINLLGGMIIGMAQRGLPFSEATLTYSLLTVGDGLIAQIPALLISLAAATVVTRVASEKDMDLGSQVMTQLGADPRALFLAMIIMLGFGLLPGFPTPVFFAIAGLLGASALGIWRSTRAAELYSAPTPDLEAKNQPTGIDVALHSRLVLKLSAQLQRSLPIDFDLLLHAVSQQLSQEYGVSPPAMRRVTDSDLAEGIFRLDLDEVSVVDGAVSPGHLLVQEDPDRLQALGLGLSVQSEKALGNSEQWVPETAKLLLTEHGIRHSDISEVLLDRLADALRTYVSHFVGVQETRAVLLDAEIVHGELAREAVRRIPIQRTTEILRRLLSEGIPIVNLRSILEALVTLEDDGADVDAAVERVRAALARNISSRFAQQGKIVPVYLLSRGAEELVAAQAQNQLGHGGFEAVQAIVHKLIDHGRKKRSAPVTPILVSAAIRPFVRDLMRRSELDMPVLSFAEIAPEFRIHALATIDTPNNENGSPAIDNTQRLVRLQN